MKSNRHDQARVIMSTHSLKQVKPSAMAQFSRILVWDGLSREYVDELHNRVRSTLTKDQFWLLYTEVTSEPYAFLNVNMRKRDSYKRNFDPQDIDVHSIFNGDAQSFDDHAADEYN